MNPRKAAGGEKTENGWKWLYLVGGAAALIAVVIFRRNFSAEMVQFKGFGLFDMPDVLPNRAVEWFALLQEKPFTGLILLDIVDLINYGLLGLTFLALYIALREVGKSAALIAIASAFTGIAVYFASNQAFSILSLSEQYAAATSETERVMFLAAGEALLAINNYQSSGFYVSRFLVTLAGLLFSLVMLRSAAFYKATAYTGIVANLFMLGSFLALLVPTLLWLAPTISAPFRVIWMVLIAIGLFRLTATVESENPRLVEDQPRP